jgi:four helix bundle protein
MRDHKKYLAYQRAKSLAMDIFHKTRFFPSEERYGLVAQMVNSSRSVCANLAEAARRHRYRSHFLAKLTDSDSENAETENWIDFSFDCGYIDEVQYSYWVSLNTEVGKLLSYMIDNPEKFM